ncbi:MAG TPA: hypothetical protein VF765_16455 [Polyangiaceae bacterium]
MRTIVAAVGMFGLLLVAGPAAAQSCPTGQVYCSAGWCCPTMADGGTAVCCNNNPQSAGCTTSGFCGTASGDGGAAGGDGGAAGDGGAPLCPSGDLYCSSGWCCPPGQNGRMDVCCNMNPMANGCTANGNCSTSGGSSSSGGSSGGGLTPPPGCGTDQTFDAVSCGGSAYCPANAMCNGTNCQCAQGYVAVSCSGSVCNGTCMAPNYWCAPASALNGSSSGGGGGSSGGSGSGGSGGGSKGCDAAGATPSDAAPWLALIAGAAGLALWRVRRSAKG